MKTHYWFTALLFCVLASCPSFSLTPVLKVGVDATYSPLESIDTKGAYIGFDIELMQMIAVDMKMELQLQDTRWDAIIPGLQNGNYDCLISAMTITPERRKLIDFSTPYLTIRQALVVKAGNKSIKTPNDLSGKTVAVQRNTTGDVFASNIKGANMKRFDTNPLAVKEILGARADAVVMDDIAAYDTAKNNKELAVVEMPTLDKECYGIGVKKGNAILLSKINNAIGKLNKNGKLAALIQKYKPVKS